MKKIVIAHLYNNYTGSPKVLADVIQALNESDYQLHLHTNKGPGFLDEVLVDEKFYAWYTWHPNKYLRLINFMISQLLLFFSLLRYWGQDVIIYANTILPFGAGLAGWIMRKKVIYHVHETEFQPPLFTKLLLSVIRLSANKLIFVSKYLQDYHHFPNIPQEVVYNALPETFKEQVKAYQKRPEEKGKEFEILMMCSMKKAKGIFEYIKLAESLSELKFTLIISQSEEQIAQFLGDTSLPPNLILKAVQENVHPYYANADLLLSLSHPIEWPETFGMTLLEGMSYGLPMIVPPVGAPLELVEDGIQGFHHDMRQLDEIADRIRQLYEDEVGRKKLSEHARKRALDFSIEAFSKEIVRAIG